MPLSPAAPREQMHRRQVECRGYRREDGLWDVEGHMTDVKSYSFHNDWRGEVAAGEPVHDMWLRLTLDDDLVIQDVEAATAKGPYQICGDIIGSFAVLKGEQIKPGFTLRVRQLLGGTKGCTHLSELLGPMATTAFQTIYPLRVKRAIQQGRRPAHLNSCHALATDGAMVKKHWPAFYTG